MLVSIVHDERMDQLVHTSLIMPNAWCGHQPTKVRPVGSDSIKGPTFQNNQAMRLSFGDCLIDVFQCRGVEFSMDQEWIDKGSVTVGKLFGMLNDFASWQVIILELPWF